MAGSCTCCVVLSVCALRSSGLRDGQVGSPLGSFQRSSPFLQSPIFNLYHSEHEMLRYLKRLENRCAAARLPPCWCSCGGDVPCRLLEVTPSTMSPHWPPGASLKSARLPGDKRVAGSRPARACAGTCRWRTA